LVLDRDVLRPLERVDCLVLQGDLVSRDKFEVGELLLGGSELDADEVRRVAEELFDPDRPIEVRRRSGWALGPPELLGPALEAPLKERASELAQAGALVLGLAHHGRVAALVDVKLIPQTGIDELIAAA